jgi:hypothetical protein
VPDFLKLIGAKGDAAGYAIINHFKQGEVRLSQAITPSQYDECYALITQALAS